MANENYNEAGDLRAIRAATETLAAGGGGDASAANQIALNALIGEVQASPTANTVLDRLKVLATSMTTLQGCVDGLEGFTDGIETLIGSTNTLLTTQAGYVDGLEGLATSLNGYVDGLEGYVDGLEGQIGIVTETAPASDTASSGLNGRLQRVAQRLTTLLPVGSNAAASSLGVTQSTEDIARQGIVTETAPASDTASSGQNGRLQRVAQRLTSLIALLPTALGSAAQAGGLLVTQSTEEIARQGIVTETAPATDTASSGQNGRLQRIAQRLTSLIALVPAALGSAAAASSFAVTASTEDIARQGIITETAPASDTASSGQNGRLQRIAQRLTSLIALLPASLAAGGGLKVEGVAGGVAQPVSGPMTSTEFLANMRSTGTHSSVNSAASSTTILASNVNRKGARIRNSDANRLDLDLSGGTATADRAHVSLIQYESFDVPSGHTGAITGIWAADGSGVAAVIEFA